MGRALEYNLTTLRISRAYVSLLSRPEGSVTAMTLTWIGDQEIRMQSAPPAHGGEQALFVIELFDHDAEQRIDSRLCYTIAAGAVAFDEFLRSAGPVTSMQQRS